MTTIADNLREAFHAHGVAVRCRITPTHRLVRIDIDDLTRTIRTAHAARILTALRAGTCDARETLRTTK